MDKLKEIAKKMPWWGKILIGAVLLAAAWKFTPVLEILYLFFWIVVMGLAILAAFGLVTDGFYDLFKTAYEKAKKMGEEKAAAG